MAEPVRLKRKPPARTGPIRQPFAGRATRDPERRNGSRQSEARGTGPEAGPQPPGTPDASVRDAVERGVNTAYRVVEEYMRRGYEAARVYEEALNQEDAMRYDRERECGWPGAWGPMGAMMAPWMQMTRLWLDTVGCFIPGASGMGTSWADEVWCSCGCGGRAGSCRRSGSAGRCSCGCGAAYDCRGRRRRRSRGIGFTVSGDRDAEVCYELDHDADRYAVKIVEALVHEDPNVRDTIDPPEVRRSRGRSVIRVTVPDNVKAGEYSAAIFCGDRECGELCVIVHDPPKPTGGETTKATTGGKTKA